MSHRYFFLKSLKTPQSCIRSTFIVGPIACSPECIIDRRSTHTFAFSAVFKNPPQSDISYSR